MAIPHYGQHAFRGLRDAGMEAVVDDLGAYLPLDRRQALARGGDLPDRTSGAALFADVSGFTQLAEALAVELGPRRGAEELTSQLNRVYGALVDQVHAYGGSVVSFSGDAITCWFTENDERGTMNDEAQPTDSHSSFIVYRSSFRAVAAALAMQRAMRQLTSVAIPAGAMVALAIKVAVAGGPARRFLVGDPQVQLLDVLAGFTLDRLAAAGQLAVRGEVVLDAQTATLLGDAVAVAAWRTDQTGRHVAVVANLARPVPQAPWPALPPDQLTEAQIRPWLAPAVYAHLRGGSDLLLAELRPAVALMLQFGGIAYDEDAAAGAKLDAYIRAVQGVALRYEGLLLDLTIGDKGSYLYVVFGAPTAHDDDAARAVGAALELRPPAADLSALPAVRDVQIGIASGQMRCGAYGSPSRRTYGVLGDKTNLAARLMSAAAPGQIICDDAVFRRAARRWDFAVLTPVRVKGKAGLIPIYRPTGMAAHAEDNPPGNQPIVGRRSELAHLHACLDAVAAGGSRILVVDGEAGIGKSRLVAELVRLIRERGLVALCGAAQSIEQTPYRAWRDIFRSYFGLGDVADPLERQARVRAQAADAVPALSEWLPLLDDVLNLGLSDTARTSALDVTQRGEHLGEMLAALLRAWAAEQPLVMIFEDAHFLDTLSIELLIRVAAACTAGDLPILLVVVLRSLDATHPAMPQLARLLAIPGARRLSLGALSPDDTVALAAVRLGIRRADLPGALAELVRDRAGGNPLFAEELIAMLRDDGLIRVELDADAVPPQHARCIVTGDLRVAGQALPDTLQGLLLARIDRLPAEEQLTLKVASVIGLTFDYPALQHTRDQQAVISAVDLKHQLRRLAAQDLTWLESPEPHLAYRFKHVLTQEAAYQTLLHAQRRAIHRTVAGWYEYTFGSADRSVLSSESVPTPYQNSEHNPQNLPLAPYVALLAYHYRQAEDVARERYYVALLGEQAFRISAFQEAIISFQRALALTPAHTSQATDAWRGALLARLARTYQAHHDDGEVRQLYQESLALAESAGDQQGAAIVCYELGSLAYRRVAHAEALGYLERSLALYREVQDQVGEARALDRLGALYTALGDEASALACYQQALALGRTSRNRRRGGA